MILVTGGTGLVGAHLLFQLAQQNEQIRAIKRPDSNLEAVKKVFGYYTTEEKANKLFLSIEWTDADILDIPALTKAFKGVEKVYHSAALISFDPSDERKLRKINIEGTANVVNLCVANNISKLCYVSSVAAIGSSINNSKRDETSKWNPEENHNDYAISKYGAEIEVWRGSQEGLDIVIVNPGIILGPGFWNSGSGKIFKRIDNGLKYHFPKVSGFVAVKDVVEAMVLLMKSEIKNEKFILVGENLSFEYILKVTANKMGKPEPSKPLKKWMVAMGWFFQKIGSWFGAKRKITRSSINGLYEETIYDNTKLRETLNFDFTPIDKVIEETSSIYLEEN